MTDERAPHGWCACPHASAMCCGGFGPATREVTRNGARLKLCSKCDLSTDTEREYLIRPTDQAQFEFDYLGGFTMAVHLANEASWRESGYRLRYEQEWRDYWQSQEPVAGGRPEEPT